MYYLKEMFPNKENIDKVVKFKISYNNKKQSEDKNDYLITNNLTLSQFLPMISPLGKNLIR